MIRKILCGSATRLPIATGFVESAVNQVVAKRFVKKQPMRWSMSGAHFLLQIRTRVLNDELRSCFEQWYPAIAANDEVEKLAPSPPKWTSLIHNHRSCSALQKLCDRTPGYPTHYNYFCLSRSRVGIPSQSICLGEARSDWPTARWFERK